MVAHNVGLLVSLLVCYFVGIYGNMGIWEYGNMGMVYGNMRIWEYGFDYIYRLSLIHI